MNLRNLFLLSLLVFIAYLAFAQILQVPGYMDADYHFYMGQRLAAGFGFSEEILWNYLDDPAGLPHPSHSYWGPLPSVLAAFGIWLFPWLGSFAAARLPFILLTSLVPALVASLAFDLTHDRRLSWMAALFAFAAPYYLPYLLTTESFAPSLFLGALLVKLLLLISAAPEKWASYFATGFILGLLYLTRSEGLLWLLLSGFHIVRVSRNVASAGTPRLATLLGGFLLVVLPWLIRNQLAFGSPLVPGVSRVLWLHTYDDLFAYPTSMLTISRWLEGGWGRIFETWLWALGQNVLSALAVIGGVVLLPFIGWAAHRRRGIPVVQFVLLGWAALLIFMSLVFPFAGARGGFFHAGTVLQPLLWVLAAQGISQFIEWGGARRGWDQKQAISILGTGIIVVIVGLSAFSFSERVNGEDGAGRAWNAYAQHYAQVSATLDGLGYKAEAVLVNNPPGLANAAGRRAIVVPNGNEAVAYQAAQDFGVEILILEANHPQALEGLYQDPQGSTLFEYLISVDASHIFAAKAEANP